MGRARTGEHDVIARRVPAILLACVPQGQSGLVALDVGGDDLVARASFKAEAIEDP